jgi:predicted dehydrogenase
MNRHKVKIAIVGCGQIADAHLQELARIPDAHVVAVCDRFPDLAYQAARRFGVPKWGTSLTDLLKADAPDIVHVTTPPASHFALVRECLRAGVHVYVEKPFTVNGQEAEELVEIAEARRLLICLGHDQLLDPIWVACRQLVAAKAIGDVVHIDATQGYDLDGPFGMVLMSDRDHWVHRLPGGLFQNVMSHAVARIADLMPDDRPRVEAQWFSTRSDAPVATELRASLYGESASATLVFSSAARPVQRVTRILGSRGSIEVDMDARLIRRFFKSSWPGAFGKMQAPLLDLSESWTNVRSNIRRLRRSDLHYFEGMHATFRAFISSVSTGSAPPVSHADALRVTRWMDSIFTVCGDKADHSAPRRVAGVA